MSRILDDLADRPVEFELHQGTAGNQPVFSVVWPIELCRNDYALVRGHDRAAACQTVPLGIKSVSPDFLARDAELREPSKPEQIQEAVVVAHVNDTIRAFREVAKIRPVACPDDFHIEPSVRRDVQAIVGKLDGHVVVGETAPLARDTRPERLTGVAQAMNDPSIIGLATDDIDPGVIRDRVGGHLRALQIAPGPLRVAVVGVQPDEAATLSTYDKGIARFSGNEYAGGIDGERVGLRAPVAIEAEYPPPQ